MSETIPIPADETATYSQRVLSQLSGANIDPFTLHFSRITFKDFKLSVQAQRNFNTALNNLPAFKTPDEDVQLGWGPSHVLHNPRVHVFGYDHLMLSSAMVECFSEEYAAAVISTLAKRHETDAVVSPLTSRFRSTVHVCNGILATTNFALVVDDRTRLNPYGQGYNHPSSNISGLIPPRDFARALEVLEQVSNGQREEATLMGGDIMGWFSTVAEWLLGLSVSIFDKDGKKLYDSHGGHVSQIKIVFVPKTSNSDTTAKLETLFADSLSLKESETPLQSQSFGNLPFTGRVDWQSLLPKTFGQSYYRLDHQEAKTLGNALGAAARALEGLATITHPNVNPDMISIQNRSNPASWGMGLIQTISNWFPELRRLQGRMERAQKLEYSEAEALSIESAKQLEKLCGCGLCSTQNNPPFHGPQTGFCLTIMMETILALALSLSRITVIPQLYPSRAGVLAIYHSQCAKRIECKALTHISSERYKILYGNEWNASYSRRLQNCVAMFSGTWPTTDLPDNMVALSHQGICAYVLKLQQGDAAKPGSGEDVIRVVTGGICWKNKVYGRACLGSPLPHSTPAYEWEEINCTHMSEPLFVK